MTEQALFQLGIDLDAPYGPGSAQTEGYVSTTDGSVCAYSPEEPKDHFIVRNGTECAGTHLIIDLVGASGLDDIGLIEWTLRRCVKECGATLLHLHLHHFTPNFGVSGVVVLAESHISIHTWPERQYAALDVFMCGDAKPELCVEVLRRAFKPADIRVKEILRGTSRSDHGATPMSDPGYITRDGQGRLWFTETLHGDVRTAYELKRVLFDSHTPHQRLIVADSVRFGRLVALDGVTQLTMADEAAYHEMLAHVPILAHGAVEDVLIIGGGDGGMAGEVLKHRSVRRLVMVEIDAGVIDFAREHLAELHRDCFDDPRFELVIADGKDYAANATETFDLAIVDSTDPIGPGEVLFTREFYADCKRLLKPGGVLVTQNGVPFLQAGELKNTVFNFARLFADAGCYLTVVPTYVGGFMALGWGTDDEGLRAVPLADLRQRYAAAGLATRHYTPELHQGAFALPRFIADIVESARREARG